MQIKVGGRYVLRNGEHITIMRWCPTEVGDQWGFHGNRTGVDSADNCWNGAGQWYDEDPSDLDIVREADEDELIPAWNKVAEEAYEGSLKDADHTESVLDEVFDERERQEDKWGVQNHKPEGWLPILIEEVGEVARAICEDDYDNYREELIQVAAVAVAMVEALDRRRKKGSG